MYPRELLVAELLDDLPVATPTDVVAVLSARLIAAVLTTHEDRLLPPRSRVPQEWSVYAADPWVRYRTAGLPIREFRALSEVGARPTAPAEAWRSSVQNRARSGGVTQIARSMRGSGRNSPSGSNTSIPSGASRIRIGTTFACSRRYPRRA